MDLYFIYYNPGYQQTLYIESILADRCLFTKHIDRAKLFTKEEADSLVPDLNALNRRKPFYCVKDEYSSKFESDRLRQTGS